MATDNSVVVVDFPPEQKGNSYLRRHDFPEGFLFGTGTSSYQVEGAADTGGKGMSSWDDFTRRVPGGIVDGTNGNVSADMYHRFEEDIKAMKNMGFDVYRFSICWARILPGGKCCRGVSKEGIAYYNKLIDTVLANGLQPLVTLFHWDIPLPLEIEYQGFMSKQIITDFCEYAEICFWEFGDRVKWWTTLNEPWAYTVNGYVNGEFPPNKKSAPPSKILTKLPAYRTYQKPEATVPPTTRLHDSDHVKKQHKSAPPEACYTVAKNLLLAHAEAVKIYRTKFLKFQKGRIGIAFNSQWYAPFDDKSEEDIAAARRAQDFVLGWFLDPVVYGRWPQNMIDYVPEGLPQFSPKEAELLKGSIDYIGLNYYTTDYVQNDPKHEDATDAYDADQCLTFPRNKDGIPVNKDGIEIGPPSGSDWLTIVPWGIYELLKFVKKEYSPHGAQYPIYITENGCSDKNDCSVTARPACNDVRRTKYHQDHLYYVLKAINHDHVDCRGYILWSWCDNFEWGAGYSVRFGINYVDFMNYQTRYPKKSAMWFVKLLKDKDDDEGLFLEPAAARSSKRQLQGNINSNNQAASKRSKIVPSN